MTVRPRAAITNLLDQLNDHFDLYEDQEWFGRVDTVKTDWTTHHLDAMLANVADERRTALGPAGEVLMGNIKRIREGQRLTYVELAERLTTIGRPIPVLGLRRIERGERRVDVDDLMALSYALGVPIVDLLVPSDAPRDTSYNLTPTVATTVEVAWNWVRGDPWVPDPTSDGPDYEANPFGLPQAPWPIELLDFMRWIPMERKHNILREMLGRSSTALQEGQEDGRPNQAD